MCFKVMKNPGQVNPNRGGAETFIYLPFVVIVVIVYIHFNKRNPVDPLSTGLEDRE